MCGAGTIINMDAYRPMPGRRMPPMRRAQVVAASRSATPACASRISRDDSPPAGAADRRGVLPCCSICDTTGASGSVFDACVSFLRVWPWMLRPSPTGPRLALKTLPTSPGLQQRAAHGEVLVGHEMSGGATTRWEELYATAAAAADRDSP